MRNFLTPGAYVTLAPIGAEVTLQYNVDGNLEKVFAGYRPDCCDVTENAINTMLENHLVPAKIGVVGGTSWITGVLYTNSLPTEHSGPINGQMDNVVANHVWEMFFKKPKEVNFFAAIIENTTVPFHNPRLIYQTLHTAGFHMLPNVLVPAAVTDEIVEAWPQIATWSFSTRVVYQYFVYINNDLSIHYEPLRVFNIVDSIVKVTPQGEVICEFVDEDGYKFWLNYADAAAKNINKGATVILNQLNEPIFCDVSSVHDAWSSTLICKYCGKVIPVPASGVTKCNDIHCSSLLLPKIKLFLTQLNIPDPFTAEQWEKLLISKKVICITDIFLLKEFSKCKIETTPAKLLRALVPIQLLPNAEVISLYVNKCLGSTEAILYYADHTDRIASDLDLYHRDLPRLICWMSDAGNISDLQTCLSLSQIQLTGTDKQFEGAPIFRNKTILVTGDFIHGDFATVAAILRSYSAEVVTTWNNKVDCVLVGGKQTNIDGNAINLARANNKSVQNELDFFAAYEIDQDLAENLV